MNPLAGHLSDLEDKDGLMNPMVVNPMMVAWAFGCSRPQQGSVPTYMSTPFRGNSWISPCFEPFLHVAVLHPVTHVHWAVVEHRESAGLRVQIARAMQDPPHGDANHGEQLAPISRSANISELIPEQSNQSESLVLALPLLASVRLSARRSPHGLPMSACDVARALPKQTMLAVVLCCLARTVRELPAPSRLPPDG